MAAYAKKQQPVRTDGIESVRAAAEVDDNDDDINAVCNHCTTVASQWD